MCYHSRMSEGVSFDEEPTYAFAPGQGAASSEGGIPGFLITHGIAKTKQEARVVMLVVAVGCLLISGFLLYSITNKPVPKIPFVEGQNVLRNAPPGKS